MAESPAFVTATPEMRSPAVVHFYPIVTRRHEMLQETLDAEHAVKVCLACRCHFQQGGEMPYNSSICVLYLPGSFPGLLSPFASSP
jgi:hypothetical protein